MEQQVTIPIEVQMAGIPHLTNVRSISEFGLSVVTMNFDDESVKRLEPAKSSRAALDGTLPTGLQPTIGPDYSPVGQLYWYTLKSTNPRYDLMELKSLQDWVLRKAAEIGSGRGGCIELRRHYPRVPGPGRSEQADVSYGLASARWSSRSPTTT